MMRNTNTKPVLRFPEFKEDWKPLQLKEILKEHKSRNTRNQVDEVFSVAKEKGVINQKEHLGGENGHVDHPKTEYVDHLKSNDFRELS